VHVLPTGGALPGDEKLGAFRRMDSTASRIAQSYAAAREYLAAPPPGSPPPDAGQP